jgi:hypothetical protein
MLVPPVVENDVSDALIVMDRSIRLSSGSTIARTECLRARELFLRTVGNSDGGITNGLNTSSYRWESRHRKRQEPANTATASWIETMLKYLGNFSAKDAPHFCAALNAVSPGAAATIDLADTSSPVLQKIVRTAS